VAQQLGAVRALLLAEQQVVFDSLAHEYTVPDDRAAIPRVRP
jgi:hypothetical protein